MSSLSVLRDDGLDPRVKVVGLLALVVAAALARKPSRKAAKDMLVLELRRLRAMFTEIAERYVANAEGEIAAVIEAVEGKSLPAARVRKMLEVVRALSVKPRKGRRKDLARIGTIAAALRKELGE